MPTKSFYSYLSDGVTFSSTQAANIRMIYAPLCGSQSLSLKSAITPHLSGDIKINKFRYVTKPASREDLRQNVREFFVSINGKGVFSLAQESTPDSAQVTVGQLWHQLKRVHPSAGIELTALNFIPSSNESLELMRVSVKNISRKKIVFTPTAAIPIFGRSLANKHDHEHVTALLNRIEQEPYGVVVEPTMAFNEEGHKEIHSVYFVFGLEHKGVKPVGSFPTTDSFFGEDGCLLKPQAVFNQEKPRLLSDEERQGKEAVGALRFKNTTLLPGQSKEYVIAVGISSSTDEAVSMFEKFSRLDDFDAALQQTKDFWAEKIASIDLETRDQSFNAWMRWVTIQPVLRRIFGCSFLPDHDYGKGGKGWRDIWQDLLSLILIEPHLVRENLINNCAGIRIDGSNATIIGDKPGEFLADRNAITRVWMDHGCWPFLTLSLYIDQTGDFDILLEQQRYFKDPQLSRTFEKDLGWVASYGNALRDKNNQVVSGSIIEHLLVQNLTQFFNVGAHNIIRLESADWNDGLDMAFAKGESVAFMSFYGGNLLRISDLLEDLAQKKSIQSLRLAKEILILLDSMAQKPVNYDDAQEKHNHLFGTYFHHVQPVISGEYVDVAIEDLVRDLRRKGKWIFSHIRRQEKIKIKDGAKTFEWFNGYYDNQSQRVEGKVGNNVRMTLTGQVFAVMSTLATDDEVKAVINSVEKYLRDPKLGGYRLNTDFKVRHYLDLGRAFGFAYGTKENGAFFSHMIVMYAYALYSRGFSRQGYEVVQSIYKMALDTKRSKIYPGIPEYFDSEGRGMYHYLTGSASWLVLTQLAQAFGVRGHRGDLLISPQLVKEEFNKKGFASAKVQFAGHAVQVRYHNPTLKDAGQYKIESINAHGKSIAFTPHVSGGVLIPRLTITTDTTFDVKLA